MQMVKGFVHPSLLMILAHLCLQLSPTDATFACCCSYHCRLDVILLDSPVVLLVAQSLWLQYNPVASAAAALSVFP